VGRQVAGLGLTHQRSFWVRATTTAIATITVITNRGNAAMKEKYDESY
jgi:hypothetical protein